MPTLFCKCIMCFFKYKFIYFNWRLITILYGKTNTIKCAFIKWIIHITRVINQTHDQKTQMTFITLNRIVWFIETVILRNIDGFGTCIRVQETM